MNQVWDMQRYCNLQTKRAAGELNKDEVNELQTMAINRLFCIIENDPAIKAVFQRLKFS